MPLGRLRSFPRVNSASDDLLRNVRRCRGGDLDFIKEIVKFFIG
jgi:hypothetical protein